MQELLKQCKQSLQTDRLEVQFPLPQAEEAEVAMGKTLDPPYLQCLPHWCTCDCASVIVLMCLVVATKSPSFCPISDLGALENAIKM